MSNNEMNDPYFSISFFDSSVVSISLVGPHYKILLLGYIFKYYERHLFFRQNVRKIFSRFFFCFSRSGDIKSCNGGPAKKSHCYRGYNLLGDLAHWDLFLYIIALYPLGELQLLKGN